MLRWVLAFLLLPLAAPLVEIAIDPGPGASFGLVFAVLFGRTSWRWTSVYGLAIGLGFLAGPAVRAMGVGFLGLQMPTMTVTVVVAHLAYGLLLGLCLGRSIPVAGGLAAGERDARDPKPALEMA